MGTIQVVASGSAELAADPIVESLDNLEEICGWLGTFRERLRIARLEDRAQMTVLLDSLEARLRQRRAELA